MPEHDPVARDAGAAAVVGAGGFIGARVCAALRTTGVDVIPFTRQRPAVDGDRLAAGVARVRTIFLLAGRTNPALAERDPAAAMAELAEHERLLGLLIDEPRDPAATRRVVLASSGGTVYDDQAEPPYAETSPIGPRTEYGRLKVAAEELLRSYHGALEPVAARISNAYGPGQRVGTGQGVIAHWLAAIRAGEPLRLFGDPATVRDYVYIDDTAEAIAALHHFRGAAPSALNIGSGTPTSLGELADLVRSAAGRPRHELVVVPARDFDRHDTWLDVQHARDVLGWTATTDLSTGLRATWLAGESNRPGSR